MVRRRAISRYRGTFAGDGASSGVEETPTVAVFFIQLVFYPPVVNSSVVPGMRQCLPYGSYHTGDKIKNIFKADFLSKMSPR